MYLENFKKRFTKASLVGAAIVGVMAIGSLFMEDGIYSFPWYTTILLLLVGFFYGTGWYFGINLIKKAIRKFANVTEEASLMQLIFGRGFVIGIFYAMIFLVLGCFLAFVVGNFFMVVDFIRAKNNQPPISHKYTFDDDKDVSRDERIKNKIRENLEYTEKVAGTDAKQRMDNHNNLNEILDGTKTGSINIVKDESGNVKSVNVDKDW